MSALDAETTDEEARTVGTTVWMPPGLFMEPLPDRRRWNSRLPAGPAPWTLVFVKAMHNPGRPQLLAVSQRPEGICHRIRTKVYGATKDGSFEATQRSIGAGWSAVYVTCLEPPASIPGDVT